MKKWIQRIYFLWNNRQLNIHDECASTLQSVGRMPANASPYIVELNKLARGWLDDGWLWMKDDCKTALARIASFARAIKSGRWTAGCPDFLKQPSFYVSAIILPVLISGSFYLDQRHAVYAAVHPGRELGAAGSLQEGWQHNSGLNTVPGIAQKPAVLNTVKTTVAACQLQVAEEVVNVRPGPGQNEPQIGQVQYGDILQSKTRSDDNWYQVDFEGGTGWVAGWCVQVYNPAARTIPYKVASRDNLKVQEDVSRGVSSGVIDIARRYLGRPYVYGADGPSSFDCSGFVRYVYARCGVDLPRVASEQAQTGKRVSSPAPDDLVFFSDRRNGYITHVGIYLGNNSFINANNGGVTITSLDDPWYRARYVMACKVR